MLLSEGDYRAAPVLFCAWFIIVPMLYVDKLSGRGLWLCLRATGWCHFATRVPDIRIGAAMRCPKQILFSLSPTMMSFVANLVSCVCANQTVRRHRTHHK